MSSRGQNDFIRLPRFAVHLYDSLTHLDSIQLQHHEIAAYLTAQIDSGRLLDVGTGPGVLLAEIHSLKPEIELHGLDISTAMIELAKKQLVGTSADLRVGDIRKTNYPDQFFDIVTCTGSFYLWDQPEKGLGEIHRILKIGGSAFLFETYRDHNIQAVKTAIQHNLRGENIFRKLISPNFLLRQLKMTYSTQEIANIIGKTPFTYNYSIEKIVLGGLPAFVRIRLAR